jgi:hypothetical protein
VGVVLSARANKHIKFHLLSSAVTFSKKLFFSVPNYFSGKEMSVQAFDIDFSGNLSTLFIEKHVSNATVCFYPYY